MISFATRKRNLMHTRRECPASDRWPSTHLMDTYDIPFDGIEDHVAELLEEMDGSSVVINKGNELEVLYDRWLFVNPDSTGGDFAGFTMQVCKVFFCPFCGKDLTVKPEEVSAQMSLGLPAEL